MGHPGGVAAGVASLREAWDAALAGVSLSDHAKSHPALAHGARGFRGARPVNSGYLISYYGDDFTGSTDVLEALSQQRRCDRAVH